MTTTELQSYLNRRIAQLSPDLLKLVVEFVDFLLHKQSKSPDTTSTEALGWSPGFFEETFGAWQGEPLEREEMEVTAERELLR